MAAIVRDGVPGGRDRLVDVAVADALLLGRRQAGAEPRGRPRGAPRAGGGAARLRPRRHRGGAADGDRLGGRQAGRSGVLRRAGAGERQDGLVGAAAREPVPARRRSAMPRRRGRRSRTTGAMVVPQVGCRPLELRFDFAAAGVRARQQRLSGARSWRSRATSAAGSSPTPRSAPSWRRSRARSSPRWPRAGTAWSCALPASERTTRWQDRSVVEIAAERGNDAGRCLLRHGAGRRPGRAVGRAHAQLRRGRGRARCCAIRPACSRSPTPARTWTRSATRASRRICSGTGCASAARSRWRRPCAWSRACPAERYGLAGRGRLAPGCAADLVLLRSRVASARGRRRWCTTCRSASAGSSRAPRVSSTCYVNGAAVVERGVPAGRRPGRVLRGGL